jgi:PAS domain S-box-containing protein
MSLPVDKFKPSEMFGNFSDAVILTDIDEQILYLNEAAVKLYGVLPAQTEGKKLAELFTFGNHSDLHSDIFKKALQNPGYQKLMLHRTPSGYPIPVDWCINILPTNENGNLFINIIREVVSLKNITTQDPKSDQETLKSRSLIDEELQLRATELQSLSRQLEEEIELKANSRKTIENKNRELTIFNQLISYSSKSSSLHDFLEVVLEYTLDYLDFDGGGIYLVNQAENIADLVVTRNLPQFFIDSIGSVPIDQDLFKTVFREGKAVYIDDKKIFFPQLFKASGLRTFASVPIFAGEQVIGAFNVGSKSEYKLREMQKSILNLIGKEIGNSITSLKTQEALRDSELRIKMIVRDSPLILWSLDKDGKIEYAEGKALDSLGLKKEDLIGKSGRSFYPEHSKITTAIDQSLKGKSFISDEIQIGNTFFETSITPVYDENGELVSINGVSMDVTTRKNYEIEIEKANEELREIDTIKNNFISTISHELRTPLVGISGYLELIMTRQLEEQQVKDFSQIALASCRRLEQTIVELLDISSLQTDTMQFDFINLDLNPVIDETVKRLTPSAKNNNVKIACRLKSDLPLVKADENKISSVIQNLIDNAIKFTAEAPQVTISTDYDDSNRKVTVSIADNGVGIDPKYLDKIFSRFYQIDSSATRRYGGSGIGLYLVKEIIEAHGGSVLAESTPGQGATFSFTLPYAEKQ